MKRQKHLVANGMQDCRLRRHACYFDEITENEIRQLALEEGCSFASKVRDLVEWGLMAVKEKKD